MILQIETQSFNPWETFHIRKSLLEMAGSYAGGTNNLNIDDTSQWNINSKSTVKVFIGNELLITGNIDNIDMLIGRESTSLNIRGRDKTADLIDGSYENEENEFIGLTVADIISRLADPIPINNDALINDVIDSYKANEGEMIIHMINRLARDYGFIPIPTTNGQLSLVKAGASTADDPIIPEENAIKSRLIYDNYNRYSKYIVKGYGIGNDNKEMSDYINPTGQELDNNIRGRELTLFTDSAATNQNCITRAKFEARFRAGMSRLYQYRVQEFQQTSGKIWKFNDLVKVKDDRFGINKFMLICEVDYIRERGLEGSGEEYTLLTVCHPETFDINSNIDSIKGGIFE